MILLFSYLLLLPQTSLFFDSTFRLELFHSVAEEVSSFGGIKSYRQNLKGVVLVLGTGIMVLTTFWVTHSPEELNASGRRGSSLNSPQLASRGMEHPPLSCSKNDRHPYILRVKLNVLQPSHKWGLRTMEPLLLSHARLEHNFSIR